MTLTEEAANSDPKEDRDWISDFRVACIAACEYVVGYQRANSVRNAVLAIILGNIFRQAEIKFKKLPPADQQEKKFADILVEISKGRSDSSTKGLAPSSCYERKRMAEAGFDKLVRLGFTRLRTLDRMIPDGMGKKAMNVIRSKNLLPDDRPHMGQDELLTEIKKALSKAEIVPASNSKETMSLKAKKEEVQRRAETLIGHIKRLGNQFAQYNMAREIAQRLNDFADSVKSDNKSYDLAKYKKRKAKSNAAD